MKQNVDMRRISGAEKRWFAELRTTWIMCTRIHLQNFICILPSSLEHKPDSSNLADFWRQSQTVIQSLILSSKTAAVCLTHRWWIVKTTCTLTGRNQLCHWDQIATWWKFALQQWDMEYCVWIFPKGVTFKVGLLCLLKRYNCHLLMSSASLGYLRFKPTVQLLTHPCLTCK